MTFTSLERFRVAGRGRMVSVIVPEDVHPKTLLGRHTVDGVEETVTGVEYRGHSRSVRKGDQIALVLRGQGPGGGQGTEEGNHKWDA